MDSVLNCETYRRFGVEIEVNTATKIIKKLGDYDTPVGSEIVAGIVHRATGRQVELAGWHSTHNNSNWIVKPDSSCGMEICSPVLKGWRGLRSLLAVVDALRKNDISADNRCSLHVHVNIGDLNITRLANVIGWYIKCEPVLIDSMPSSRKMNRYCQMLGLSDLFTTDVPMDPLELLMRVSTTKYFGLNAFHFYKGGAFDFNSRKETIEFRQGENLMCLNPIHVKNWIRLLLHFVEVTKDRPLPPSYVEGDRWTGLAWLELSDVLQVLRFDQGLSDGLQQVKGWFLDRLRQHIYQPALPGVWSPLGRSVARQQLSEIVEANETWLENLWADEGSVFGKKYIK